MAPVDIDELFKKYLFVVIETEGTIFDSALVQSSLISEDELTVIRKLADDAEDEYEK